MQREPFKFPVRVVLTRILGPKQRLWDADSVLRGSAKQLIDGLVDAGWFVDDGPKYITEMDGRQDKSNRTEGPAVLIEVFKDDKNENTFGLIFFSCLSAIIRCNIFGLDIRGTATFLYEE